jgi:hypothetical protein
MPQFENETEYDIDMRQGDDEFTQYHKKNRNDNRNKNDFFVRRDENGTDEYIFSSKCQGTYIRSATNGIMTYHKVGSPNENLYFSVIDSTGFNRSKEPKVFYFDSPEQFERIMESRLDSHVCTSVKKNWVEKYVKTKNNLHKNKKLRY